MEKNSHKFYLFFLLLLIVFLPATVLAQLSGTKTIGGTTPDYQTIKAAILDLNAQGVTTPGVTFLIRDGVYNEDSLLIATTTSSASAPIVFKPDAGATVVINVTPPNTTYNFAIKIEATQYVTIDGSNNGTTSRDLTINSLGTSGQRGIWVSSASHYATIKNCNVNAGTDIATPTTSVRGIDFLYLTGTGNDADFILCENNYIRYAYTAIRLEGVASGDVMESAIVRNNIADSVANAGVYSHYQNNSMIYNNDLNVLRGSSATIYGIYVGTASSNVRVFKNKVHDITQLSTSTSVTYGIYVSGTSSLAMNAVYNNFIYSFNIPATGTGAVYGIYSGIANTAVPDTFAFNSVNLTGTSGGNRTSSAFYKGSATGPAYVYNNIFQNTRTDGTTGIASAIYKLGTTTVLNSDNNNLYVGTPDAQHVTGRIGSTTYSLLSDWQTANLSDGLSVVENSPFVGVTDLHLQTTVPTQLESGGAPIAGINDDIDGDLRNTTTPDIGADEGNFMGLDLTSPLIAYTPIPNTTNTTSVSLTATITDPSGVATGANLPRFYLKKSSSVTYVFDDTPTVAGDDYTFSIDYTTIGGVAAGDTLQYYVAAQDMLGNAGTYPIGGSGSNPPGTTPPGTPDFYLIIGAPLSGDYTVGLLAFRTFSNKEITFEKRVRTIEITESLVNQEAAERVGIYEETLEGTITIQEPADEADLIPTTVTRTVEQEYFVPILNGNEYEGSLYYEFTPEQIIANKLESRGVYATITEAVNDAILRGVSAAVRFLLVDATYPSETFPIVISAVPGASAVNTVTILPNTGVTTTITGSVALPIFDLNGTSYIVIDGRQNGVGTTNSLTISNTSTASSSGCVRFINGATFNAVQFVNLIAQPSSSTTRALEFFTSASAPSGNSNNLISNCDVNSGRYCIYFSGTAANPNMNNTIANSKFYDGTFAQFYMVSNASSTTIVNNEFFNVVPQATAGSAISMSASALLGVNNIIGNKFYDLQNSSTSTLRGITGTPGAGSTLNIINNFFSFTKDDTTKTSIYAIQISGTTEHTANIHYNTFNFAGVHSGGTAGVIVSGGLIKSNTSATSVFNAKNNIGKNTRTGGTAGVIHTNFFAGTTALVGTLDINYNAWYAFGDPGSYHAGWSGIVYNDLTAYRTAAAPHEQQTIFKDVNFVSGVDLHLAGLSVGDADLAGLPLAGITDDIDGDVRDLTYPYRGADESAVKFLPILTPSNLVVIPDTLTAELSWLDNSNNEAGFIIQRKDGDSLSVNPFVTIDTVVTNVIYYLDSGLNPNTTYTWRVFGYNALVNSAFSNMATATTFIPVELTAFTAEASGREVLVSWATATELNNRGFDIERNMNGEWEKIGFKDGRGTTTTESSYSFIDKFTYESFVGTITYRLKQMDFSGTYTYSPEVEVDVDFTPKEYTLYQNYPNPFNPVTTIKYSLPFESYVRIAVYNILGEMLDVLVDETKQVGFHDYNWNASNLASGIYIYTIEAKSVAGDKNYSSVKKMILMK